MLYLKEDDMDEMMRKAAENYHVDADKAADWNAVYAAVHGDKEAVLVEEKRKKRGFVFWWLFLIPLGWIAHTEYNKFNNSNKKITTKSTQVTQVKTNPDKNIESNKAENKSQDQSIKKDDNSTTANVVSPSTQPQSTQLKFSLKNVHPIKNSFLGEKNSAVQNNQPVDESSNKIVTEPVQQDLTPSTQARTNNSEQSNTIAEQENKTTSNALPPVVNQQKDSATSITSDQTKNTDKPATTNKTTSLKKEKSNSHYFYAGLVAGADMSFIKFQNAQSVGYNAGLLVGYKFNKVSVESGLLLDQKNYYTKGEYFNKSKLHYFDDAELLKASGYCRMFEIPVNIKYDISTRKKHTWFATAGLSSYLMNKEFYNFDYIKDNQHRTGSYPYYHTTKNWFSVVNFSAGYQLQMANKINLRIEPYYKLPLTGVGTGNLNISSTGINVGVTRRIP